MPALLAKRYLSARGVTLIRVLTDDPMAPVDIPHMCRGEGHEVVALERNGDETCIVLRARKRL